MEIDICNKFVGPMPVNSFRREIIPGTCGPVIAPEVDGRAPGADTDAVEAIFSEVQTVSLFGILPRR